MRKSILVTSSLIFAFFLVVLTYLTVYGIQTDRFNNLINNKVKEYNPRIKLKLDKVFLKLNPAQRSLIINSENVNFEAESNLIRISKIDINLNLFKFIKNENSIKSIKIKSSDNFIKDVTSFINTIDYDLTRYLFFSQIKQGIINFELNAQFDESIQNNYSYIFSGSVRNGILNLPGYDYLNKVNFNFRTQDKIVKISNLNFSYQEIDLFSKNLEIISKQSGSYFIKGDIENSKVLLNPNFIFDFVNIKQDYLSNKNIFLQSKNSFSFTLNKYKQIKDFKIYSTVNFDEIYFNNKYQNIIFIKEGVIKSTYENKQYNAVIDSKFAFLDEIKLNNDDKINILKLTLNKKNNHNIKIKGTIKNEKTYVDPKIILNILNLNPNILSNEKINIETDSEFQFEINKNELESYQVNSTINLDQIKPSNKIHNTLYLKDIKTKLSFGDDLLKIDLKSNYSFFNKNYNSKSDNNILNLKLEKTNLNIANVEVFLKTDKNKINTKEFKKYLNFKDDIINDQVINLNSNSVINFSIDNFLNIENLSIRSDLNFDNLILNYKYNFLKEYLKNYNNTLNIKNPNILFEYSNEIINLEVDGKYSLDNKDDKFFIKFKGDENNYQLYSLFDLKNSILNLENIKYHKKKNTPSKLEINLSHSELGSNFEQISYIENENYILLKNLNMSDNFKIKSVDEIDIKFLNKNGILNNFKIKKKLNNYSFTGDQIDGEKLVEQLLISNNENKISEFFDNINYSVIINLNKIYLEKNEYLENFTGEFDIKDNKLYLAKANAVLNTNNKFSYSYRTTLKNEKITNIFVENPKPFLNNYKFIKGFEEGELKLNSVKIDNTSRSNLKITNFKVKEVPVLAKILTLASLQGIADLLTGEGIRFDDFEMDFKTKNNLTEIDELYAIGPAISIMMEGFIEKNRLTSLRGTLVPATTINKTISKIPLLGDILVGTKTGEGVFGVSFKIKGSPNDLKSTVNPIKTLTPRFITRTLENLKGN